MTCLVILLLLISCNNSNNATDAYVECILVAVEDNIEEVCYGERRRLVFDFVLTNHNDHDVYVPIGWKDVNDYNSKIAVLSQSGSRIMAEENGNTSYYSHIKPNSFNHIRVVLTDRDLEKLKIGFEEEASAILSKIHFEYIRNKEDEKVSCIEISDILFLRKDTLQYVSSASCSHQ